MTDLKQLSTLDDFGRSRPSKQGLNLSANQTFGNKSLLPNESAKNCIAPPPESAVKLIMDERAALLNAYRAGALLPADRESDTFGAKTRSDGTAKDSMSHQVDETAEEEARKRLYLKSHHSYAPGEQIRRGYSWQQVDPTTQRFGVSKPRLMNGELVASSLKWRESTSATIVPERVDAVRHRSTAALGQALEPNQYSKTMPASFAYGLKVEEDTCSAGDLIHYRGQPLRGQSAKRAAIAAAQYQLQRANFQSFRNIEEAFLKYDIDGSGAIDINELKQIVKQLSLPIRENTLEDLLVELDVDKNGVIDHREFLNFLNWTQALPDLEGINHQIDTRRPSKTEPTQHALDKVFGPPGGVPTIRTDVAAPRLRRITERRNFGDESDARGLLAPNIFSSHGVYPRDMLAARTPAEIKTIFGNLGVNLSEVQFQNVWEQAASLNRRGQVSVQAFRQALEMIETTDR